MSDPNFDEACRLVGRYLHTFAQVETALDDGVARLLGADGRGRVVLVGVLPLAQKMNVLFATEREEASRPDNNRTKLLRETNKLLRQLNDDRILAAHSSFEAIEGGLRFQRLKVSDGKVIRRSVEWTSEFVDDRCLQAQRAIELIKEVVDGFQPFVPSLDFSDPRNSMYLAALF